MKQRKFLNSANRQGPQKPSKLMKTLNWVTWGKRWQMLGQGVVSLQELRNSVDNFWFWKRRVVEACWGWPRDEFSGKHDVLWLEQHHFDGFNFRGLSHRKQARAGWQNMRRCYQHLPTTAQKSVPGGRCPFLQASTFSAGLLDLAVVGESRLRFHHFSMWKLCGNCADLRLSFSTCKGRHRKSTSNLKRHSMAHCSCKMILGSWLFVFAFSYSGSNKTHIKIESKMNRASINKLCMLYTYIYICKYIIYIYMYVIILYIYYIYYIYIR